MRIHPSALDLQSVAIRACERLMLDPFAPVEGHVDIYGSSAPCEQWLEVAEQMRRHAVFDIMHLEAHA